MKYYCEFCIYKKSFSNIEYCELESEHRLQCNVHQIIEKLIDKLKKEAKEEGKAT
ncbi:conserved hypothetical protein [Caldicellulosiruptor hydrothermalis 108]|uniref:Uncharacterized protein n=1 Tax=Caldicellulosiruptor hydrothermalis (strain DSM 18901 / VKM B-2411 / 108) TaxID=632292 RepID=E4QDS4_CALH1|nr:hypothetical protein [Caldicellulosiruptor hydrothermalis]ADQ06491.1 conserved hypothetical protein [Caldicellulosiruptor hydrothermalis 108]